jgi:hypothetical protein
MRYGFAPARQRNAAAEGIAPLAKSKSKRRNGSNGGTAATGPGPRQLLADREKLSAQFAELQWDLGGMAYEMASRDHYRLDVLNKQAARLQEVDAQLGQIEHLIKLDQAGAAGSCPSCGALQARGAVFCWQCGNEVKKPTGTPQAK